MVLGLVGQRLLVGRLGQRLLLGRLGQRLVELVNGHGRAWHGPPARP